jgi:hypothetical protein
MLPAALTELCLAPRSQAITLSAYQALLRPELSEALIINSIIPTTPPESLTGLVVATLSHELTTPLPLLEEVRLGQGRHQ